MTNIWDLKQKQKAFYKSIVSVFCPILNDTVYFTSDGYHHLLYESNRTPRKIAEQFMKLHCLTHAPDVIKNCALVSETRKIQKKIDGKLRSGVHYELIHEACPGKKIRVIIEKIGTGKHRFLSVMPHKQKVKKSP